VKQAEQEDDKPAAGGAISGAPARELAHGACEEGRALAEEGRAALVGRRGPIAGHDDDAHGLSCLMMLGEALGRRGAREASHGPSPPED
jgi:hypothetical protein